MKRIIIGLIITTIILLPYLSINLPFVATSIKAKFIFDKMNKNEYIDKNDKTFADIYIQNVSECRIRGCTVPAKILLAACSKTISEWAIGKQRSLELDRYLNKFNDNNFWSESYNITNLDILNQRIENLKNENFRYEDLYKDYQKYFYDCVVIKDNGEYILRFTVWKKDKTCTEKEIIYGINEIVVKHVLLTEENFRKNIKVLIELFGVSAGDDLEKVLYNDYVK